MTIKPKKSKEEMLEDLERVRAEVRKKYGRDLTLDDFKRPDISNAAAYRHAFGGINNALKALDRVTAKPDTSKLDAALAAIVAFVDKNGRMPTRMELEYCPDLPGTYADSKKIFGSYLALQHRIGALRPGTSAQHTEETAMIDLKLKAAEVARPLAASDFASDERMPSISIYTKFFGGLAHACSLAGISFQRLSHSRIGYSNGYLILKMQTMASRLGYQPTAREVQDDPDMPQSDTYRKRFGTWDDVMRETGVDHLPVRLIKPKDVEQKKAEAIADLQNLVARLGRIPTSEEVSKNRFTHSMTYYISLFGSRRAAFEAAGIELPTTKRGRKPNNQQPPLGP